MEQDTAGIHEKVENEKEASKPKNLETIYGEDSRITTSVHSIANELNEQFSNKLPGRNYNGTVVFTSHPKNEAEIQLYRVMQRASLLSYYDTLLEMGGDDVQQLCDAGEDEFLEIMALVGMASKPLHVRRFQKALQEWLADPMTFLNSFPDSVTSVSHQPRPLSVSNTASSPMHCSTTSMICTTPASSPNKIPMQQLSEITCSSALASSPASGSASSFTSSPCPSPPTHNIQPKLNEQQLENLEKAALRLIQNLPELRPKLQNTKKKVCKDLQVTLNMPIDDPLRMENIRKFSAIYGRFDCKRKTEKPLTLHEVSVNEAAAQICKHIPALLTRRDELFPLARQVVRDSGYHYSKGHSKCGLISLRVGYDLICDNFNIFHPLHPKIQLIEHSVGLQRRDNSEATFWASFNKLLHAEVDRVFKKMIRDL